MNKLLIVIADKVDPYVVSGIESDRILRLKESIPHTLISLKKLMYEFIKLQNESLVLHQYGSSNAQDGIK